MRYIVIGKEKGKRNDLANYISNTKRPILVSIGSS